MRMESGSDAGSRAGHGHDIGKDHQQRPGGLKEVLEGLEYDLILEALRESHGNKAKAARALGITERFIGLRVKRLGIDWRGLRITSKRTAELTPSLQCRQAPSMLAERKKQQR